MKPILFSTPMVQAILDGRKTQTRRMMKPQLPSDYPLIVPKHKPGDILWVRETWNSMKLGIFGTSYWYKADEPRDADTGVLRERWRPSIFMPREAARIYLRVTGVRAERLQELTEDDALSEGLVQKLTGKHGGVLSARIQFADLWDNLNAKRGYGWDSNPWVWVISFERCEKPE